MWWYISLLAKFVMQFLLPPHSSAAAESFFPSQQHKNKISQCFKNIIIKCHAKISLYCKILTVLRGIHNNNFVSNCKKVIGRARKMWKKTFFSFFLIKIYKVNVNCFLLSTFMGFHIDEIVFSMFYFDT